MDADLKARWTAALRSGEYAQGQGVLRSATEDGKDLEYCCLGVLLDTLNPEGWRPSKHALDHQDVSFVHSTNDGGNYERTCSLDPELVKALGMPAGPQNDSQGQLVRLNDVLLADFDQIADWIDKNL